MNNKKMRELRAKAHSLNPVVTIGNNGLTDGVVTELELALDSHELIKLKLPAGDKADKIAVVTEACARTKAESIQLIGRVAVLYREKKD